MKRKNLIEATGLDSSYTKNRKRLDISEFNNKGQCGNFICEDMFEALKELNELVSKEGGNMYIIDLFRSWGVQAKARSDYDAGIKKAYVANPGESFHNAGRAVDIDVKKLGFKSLDKEDWLKVFWSLAKPLGFRPIIDSPDLSLSECWHFDFPGEDWMKAYDKLSYSETAKCTILDVGEWDPEEDSFVVRNMFVQSQLIRLGHYEIGKVDGIVGPKTMKAIEDYGLERMSRAFQAAQLVKKS